MIELLSFCAATFRKSLAKVTRPAAARPFGISILKTAWFTRRPACLLGEKPSTNLLVISVAALYVFLDAVPS